MCTWVIFSAFLGNNSCSGPTNGGCMFICVPYPNGTHVCLCPEWSIKTKQANGSEICSCANGHIMLPNGTCNNSMYWWSFLF